MLQLRIGEAFEEFAEPVNLIALGDDDVNGETKIEDALDHIQLLRDLAGLGGDIFGGIFDQTVGRNDEQQAVDRTIGAVLSQQLQEFAPFTRLAGFNFLEHQSPGGIEHDRVVGEPPVHVDGAARAHVPDAVVALVHAGREPDVAMTDRLGLARARLANDHVPGQRVQVFAARPKRFDAFLEFFAKAIELRDIRGAHAAGCGGGAGADIFAEARVLLFAFPDVDEDETAGDDSQQDDEHDGEGQQQFPIAATRHSAHTDHGAHAGHAQDPFQWCRQVRKFIHRASVGNYFFDSISFWVMRYSESFRSLADCRYNNTYETSAAAVRHRKIKLTTSTL